jgi:hypothetical protein
MASHLHPVNPVLSGFRPSLPSPRRGKFLLFNLNSKPQSRNPKLQTNNALRHTNPMNTISEERLAANRANAQKSTGPKTPKGRAARGSAAI